MEKKERIELQKRLEAVVLSKEPLKVTFGDTLATAMMFGGKPNLKPLLDFIDKELDKAREEGRKEEEKQSDEVLNLRIGDNGPLYDLVKRNFFKRGYEQCKKDFKLKDKEQ